jgi:PAS domain S-box-containing protein
MSNNWIVVTTQPAQVANRPINWMVAFSAMAFGFTLIISIWAQLRNVRRIIGPISALEQRAANLVISPCQPISVEAMGRFQEIYSLNQSFEKMASEIHERDRYLEEQVIDRTAEVQEKARELELTNQILQQHTWDLTLINDVNTAFNRGDSIETILGIFSEKTRTLQTIRDGAGALVFLFDDDPEFLVVQNSPSKSPSLEQLEKFIGYEFSNYEIGVEPGSIHETILKKGQPIILNEPREIEDWIKGYASKNLIKRSFVREQLRKLAPQVRKMMDFKSILVVPLLWEGQPIGLIELYNDAPCSVENTERLALIASQLAIAIQRSRADEEIRSLKEFNEGVVQTVPGAIVVNDLNGKFSFVNPETVDLLGYQPEELMGKHWGVIFPPDQYELVYAADDRRSRGDADSYEIELLHKDGNRIPALIKGSPRYDSQSKDYIGTMAVLTDISDRKRAENAILQEKEFSDEIVNSLPGIFFIFNADGKITRWNKNFERLTGYTDESIRSSQPIDFIAEVDHGKAVEAINTGFTKGEVTLEAQFRTKDGPVPFYFVAFLTFIDDDPHLMGNAIDITERVQAEEKLKQRSLELERSNQDLERFAYISSHDLQEPLRKIQAFGDRLRSKYAEKLDERGLDYLLRMQEAGRRGQEIVEDLLVYSRVSTRGGDFESVNLNRLAERVLEDLKNSIELSDALVTVGVLPAIKADPTQMYQLLHHLIDNALKFRQTDNPPVIRFGAEETPKNQVVLTIQDNGIGFEEQYLEKIFQPFQRLHGRDVYDGSGIGLAICRKIVDRHGGLITARSKPGEGATFTITLPLQNNNKQKE